MLSVHLGEEIAERVRCILIVGNPQEDMMGWGEEPSNDFSERSGYKILIQSVVAADRSDTYKTFYKKTLVDQFTRENKNYNIDNF